MTTPLLKVHDLSLGFASDDSFVKVIKNVSFALPRGRMLAIVGESGCGKSVTAHAILRLLPRTAHITGGTVTLNTTDAPIELSSAEPFGAVLRRVRGNEIGMVFQDAMTALNPAHTVGRQTAESLRHHRGISKDEARQQVIALFEELGIPEAERRYDAYPHELSGGMRQRVMIAIAMICRPSVLIADEPTTALDVTIQAQIMSLIKRLQIERNTSVILITHNMGLVAEYADEIAVMYMGRVVEVGPVHVVLRRPSHPYTQALVASVPTMAMDKDRPLQTISGSTPNPTDLGDGCDFAGRCPVRVDACGRGTIAMVELSPSHQARCLKLASAHEGEGNNV